MCLPQDVIQDYVSRGLEALILPAVASPSTVRAALQCGSRLRVLDISLCWQITDHVLETVCDNDGPNLEKVMLEGTQVTDRGLVHLLNNMPTLHYLESSHLVKALQIMANRVGQMTITGQKAAACKNL